MKGGEIFIDPPPFAVVGNGPILERSSGNVGIGHL